MRAFYYIGTAEDWAKEPCIHLSSIEDAVNAREVWSTRLFSQPQRILYVWDQNKDLIAALDVTMEYPELTAYSLVQLNMPSEVFVARELEKMLIAHLKRINKDAA